MPWSWDLGLRIKSIASKSCYGRVAGLGQTGFVLKTEHSQTPLGFHKTVVSYFFSDFL